MPRPTTTHGRTGRPPVTSRAQILAAARLLIDQDGWEKLTIRRLAAELGIGATTLYHHIRDKEDLLSLLLSQYVVQMDRPELPDDPRDRIIVAATALHDALASWPWAAEVLTADGFVGSLDEEAMWMVEAIVGGAMIYGCTSAQSIDLFRNVWYYTVGEILVRANTARRWADELSDLIRDFHREFDASKVPYLAAVSDQWAEVAQSDTYPRGLRTFVDALLARAMADQEA